MIENRRFYDVQYPQWGVVCVYVSQQAAAGAAKGNKSEKISQQ